MSSVHPSQVFGHLYKNMYIHVFSPRSHVVPMVNSSQCISFDRFSSTTLMFVIVLNSPGGMSSFPLMIGDR